MKKADCDEIIRIKDALIKHRSRLDEIVRREAGKINPDRDAVSSIDVACDYIDSALGALNEILCK